MLCEKCGKVGATTHIRSVINGVVHEKHLCSNCAVSEGYNDAKGNNLSQILSSMFDDTLSSSSKMQLKRCNCCGSTFADISESGKCGCPECYTVFYEQLLPYLKRVHGSTKHMGKTPNCPSVAERKDKKETVAELRTLLNRLVSEEKYEEAAVLRDKIKKLEGDAL